MLVQKQIFVFGADKNDANFSQAVWIAHIILKNT